MTPRPQSRFSVGPDEFRHGQLNALDEFHCCRRVAPLVQNTGAFVSALIAGSETDDESDRLAGMIEGSAPLLQAFSLLADDDADFVIERCLGVTEARDGDAWVPTWDHDARAPAIPALRLNHLLRISYQVLRDALAVFFSDAALSLIELGLLRRASTP